MDTDDCVVETPQRRPPRQGRRNTQGGAPRGTQKRAALALSTGRPISHLYSGTTATILRGPLPRYGVPTRRLAKRTPRDLSGHAQSTKWLTSPLYNQGRASAPSGWVELVNLSGGTVACSLKIDFSVFFYCWCITRVPSTPSDQTEHPPGHGAHES